MKIMLSSLIIMFSIFSSSSTFRQHQDKEDIREIRFKTLSRGYQKSIVVRPDSTIILEQGIETGEKEVKRKTSAAEWEQLIEAIPDYPLDQLNQLEAPGMDRASDKARHSRITIKTNLEEYRSAEFDNERPHEKLMPLMKSILRLEEKKH